MARPVRIHIPNALYLLQIRVRPDSELFTCEEERGLFLASMSDAAEAYGVTTFAFALLPQSILLFVRAGQLPLSQYIHRCQAGYLNRLKALSFRELPKIRDRHRAILVQDGPLFEEVMQRVHLAPVIGGHWSNQSEARRLGEILKTRWTSLPIYSGQDSPPAWFDRSETISRLAHLQPERPDEAPFWCIMQGAKQVGRTPDVLDQVKAMSLLGSDEFIAQHYDRARGRTGSSSSILNRGNGTSPNEIRVRFNRLNRLVARHYGTAPSERLKARARHPGRKLLIELSMRHLIGKGGIRELGERLNISGSAIAHMRRQVRHTLRDDNEFATKLADLELQFLEEKSSRTME
ncbi:MAG TPA: hypothetical protein ENH10_07215 [Bacteroidetes bacterium]|nr:hypothetical protein [Bacteroidota bacterium]HEX04926.1 hypothetical protein [Bacteroidota bacterium]